MSHAVAVPVITGRREAARPSVARAYWIEALASVGGTLLQMGIFFYTSERFGWGPARNFSFAACQGLVYTIFALQAHRISLWLGRRRALMVLYPLMALMALSAALLSSHAIAVAGLVVAHTALMAMTWPILEGIVSSGTDATGMSRRVAIYNLVWSSTGAAAFAFSGSIIQFRIHQFHALGVFAIPLVVHLISFILLATWTGTGATEAETPGAAHEPPSALLMRRRKLALWLSRISLPATYVVTYSLSAMLPSLPVLQGLSMAAQTAVGSIWLMGRWAAFAVALATTAWHERPRILWAAAIIMLVGFLGVTIQGSHIFGAIGAAADLWWMIGWQVVLGLAMGMIYTGSLYFGMVLSDGSTEHGGYHEALIGLGQTAGPAMAAAAQWWRPSDLSLGIWTVAGIITLSVALATVASISNRD